MARILTGIQSSGKQHLGNILGAIKPAIELAKNTENEALFFIANLHSLTSLKNGEEIRENTYTAAAAWLAFGFDTEKNLFYRQSDVPEVCELAWYLNCFTPIPMLENAHSFKDKSAKVSRDKINSGLFTYPVLMTADILLYQAEIIPVGKDQRQHIEMTRDIAKSFNHQYGEVFTIPEAKIDESVMTIPGIDGRKMSKSYNNYIDLFQSDKLLKKNIMSIETDSTPLEEPKEYNNCNVFKIFSLLASNDQIDNMKQNYQAGGYGYGHAKKELLELIKVQFDEERRYYNELMNDTSLIDQKLKLGAEKARDLGAPTLTKVRKSLGY